jgi:hypothetical protein
MMTGLTPAVVLAQKVEPDSAPQRGGSAVHRAWTSRLAVDVAFGALYARGESEFFALVDRALTPGAEALRPRGMRGAVRYWVRDRWAVRSGFSQLERAVNSTSRLAPQGEAVSQQTAWQLSSWDILGAEWRGYRWTNHGQAENATREVRVLLGAGVGTARYRLRQVGRFVDASRGVSYADDFRSSGRGTTGYLAAAAELEPASWAALRLEWRGSRGTAPMNEDFAGFDRLDMGGHQLSIGAVLHPFGHRAQSR